VLELQLKQVDGKLVVHALRERQPHEPDPDPLLTWMDNRIVVIELHRPGGDTTQSDVSDDGQFFVDIEQCPKTDGFLVAFSPALSAALGCNNDVTPLGSLAQAKAILYYLIKYVTKNDNKESPTSSVFAAAANLRASAEAGATLDGTGADPLVSKKESKEPSNVTLFAAAALSMATYPSVAEDKGTPMRNAMHLLTKVENYKTGRLCSNAGACESTQIIGSACCDHHSDLDMPVLQVLWRSDPQRLQWGPYGTRPT
jgi:hypothetical protein